MKYLNRQTNELLELERLEADLAEAVNDTEKQIAHSECFDEEQRAEIYSIVRAFKHECQSNRKIIGQWVNDITGEISNV